ncbi:MAG: hypothetical protein EXR98_18315 [Gemmataceae bacterium]|nr:hypothetical protein [Gemmataceae bacterium]
MQFQFDIGSSTGKQPAQAHPPVAETVPEILRQLLDQQREQLGQILQVQVEHLNHARAAAQDNLARWRQLLGRCQDQHPEFAGHCKMAYPVMENAYVQLLEKMVQDLVEADEDAFDSEFAIQEFIDRYGMKVGQLSHLLSIVGPLSEAAHQLEEIAKQQQQQQKPS